MSKAIEGAAMLGAAVGMGVLAFFNPELIASPLFDKVWASLVIGGISMEAGAIAQALTANRGQNITTRQPSSFRQIVYGTQRVGGVLVYSSTTGGHKDQYNKVIVIAGHEIDSIENLYLDGRQVFWVEGSAGNSTRNGVNFGGNADGNSHTGPNGVQYNFGSLVYCEAYFGDQTDQPNTTPGGGFSTGLQANDPAWAPSSGGIPYLGGCAYVYLKVEYDTNMFPSDPEIRFTVNGKNNIFDPRTGSTGFSSNWALIVADVLTDATFGLGLDMATDVNQAQLIAAANICDEQVPLASGQEEARYALHYHYDTSIDPGSVLETMMMGAAGRLSYIGGEYYIWPAYWQGATFNFGQPNVTSDTLTWTPKRPFRELFNCVNGTYIAPNFPYNIAGNLYDSNGFYDGMQQDNFPFAFQPTNYPQYAQDTLHGYSSNTYYTQDRNTYLPKELGLQTVLSIAQAQRIAKIYLERNRQQGSGSWGLGLECFDMQETDVTYFSFAAMGWSDKLLECLGVKWAISQGEDGQPPSIGLQYSFGETDPSVYEWSITEELTVYDVPALPAGQNYIPPPPTDMTLTSGAVTAIQTADGVLHPRIEVQWVAPADVLTKFVQVQYAQQYPGSSTATPWVDLGMVDVGSTSAYIPGVVAGGVYDVRIRGVRGTGGTSVWVEIDAYTVSLTLSVVGIVSLAETALAGQAFTDGTAAITVSPFTAVVGLESVSVLPSGSVTVDGLLQQTLYYVYYYDPTFAGGTVAPIATTNTADFVNKPGYFLIGSVVTPYAGAAGTNPRYAPSMYQDTGSQTASNPQNAYDGDLLTNAALGCFAYTSSGGMLRISSAAGTYSGFPAVTSTAGMMLYVTAAYYVPPSSSGVTFSGSSISLNGTPLASFTGSSASATYSVAIPEGTDLSTLSVQCSAGAPTGTGYRDNGSLDVYEIYAQ